MFRYSKLFRMHNINAFTGVNNTFKKANSEVITVDALDEFFNETSPKHLVYRSEDILHAFPLLEFNDVNDAIHKFGFEWHPRIKHLIVDTLYHLIDSQTLKITGVFNERSDWNTFVNVNHGNAPITHGWKSFPIGAFYDTDYNGNNN